MFASLNRWSAGPQTANWRTLAIANIDDERDRRGELSAAQARVQSDVQHMSETCVQELSQQPHELMADDSLPRVAAEALAGEEEAYREMRTRLDNMGPVNMMALEEYKEIAQR